jgi:hypothetical protein
MQTLVSKGIADPCALGVLVQLAAKHPCRKEKMPDQIDPACLPAVSNDICLVIKDLDIYSGTGASGFRDSYLKILLKKITDEKCRSAIPLLNDLVHTSM